MKGFKLQIDHNGDSDSKIYNSISTERHFGFAKLSATLLTQQISGKLKISEVLEQVVDYAETPTEVVYFVHATTVSHENFVSSPEGQLLSQLLNQ